MATPSTTITYPFADLDKAKGWFNILLSREGPDNQNPDGSILYYYIQKGEEKITLVLMKGDELGAHKEDPLVFWPILDKPLEETVEKLTAEGDTKVLWQVQTIGNSEISTLQYRRVRVGLISNPPITILEKAQ